MARSSATADWSFAWRPSWLASHLFAIVVIVSFVFLGFWQLSRHGEKAEFNERVEARSGPPATPVEGVLGDDPAELD